MTRARTLIAVVPVALAYFLAASLSMAFDQRSGHIPFLWAGGAVIIADLGPRPARQWGVRLPGLVIASLLAIGLFGRGWASAVPTTIADLAEACLAARLFRRMGEDGAPLGSLAWLVDFVIPVGLAAPVIVGLTMGCLGLLTGLPPLSAIPGIVGGHALGNICFTPLAILYRRIRPADLVAQMCGPRRREATTLFALVLAVSLFVFGNSGLPVLFLPVLPLMLVSFLLGPAASGFALMIVAAVGTTFTLAGSGPVQLIDGTMGERLLFFQFYLAATILTVLPIAADLESRKALYSAVATSEARYRLLADYSSDVLMHLDLAGRLLFVSPSIRRWGHEPCDLIADVTKLVAPEDYATVVEGHRAVIAAAGETASFEYRLVSASGEICWVEAHARLIVQQDGTFNGVVSVLRDISDRKANEERLSLEALTDALTGLPNRRAFEAAIAQRLVDRGDRETDCIAVFDIDHFKRVNDGHGHDAGDAVLQLFARVLQHVVRETDTVARIGGEEFAAHFPATSVDQALAICERIRIEMARQTTITGGEPIRVTISGGVAAFAHDNLARALKDADRALYEAKRGGRNQMTLAA